MYTYIVTGISPLAVFSPCYLSSVSLFVPLFLNSTLLSKSLLSLLLFTLAFYYSLSAARVVLAIHLRIHL